MFDGERAINDASQPASNKRGMGNHRACFITIIYIYLNFKTMEDFELFGQEHEQFENTLREQRYNEQKRNNDYDINEDGKIEKCDCGSFLNSHGHCPRCDY